MYYNCCFVNKQYCPRGYDVFYDTNNELFIALPFSGPTQIIYL